MATVMVRIAASSKKAPPAIIPTERPTFSAEHKDWPKWKRSAEAYFSLVPTSNPNKMLFYVIRTESMSTSDTLSVDSSIKSNGDDARVRHRQRNRLELAEEISILNSGLVVHHGLCRSKVAMAGVHGGLC